MVGRALLTLLLAGTANAAALTAQLDRTTVALGEPVMLTVQAQGLNLDMLDAGPLGAHFDVFGRTLGRGADGETLTLTLYPRAAGAVRVPPLRLGPQHTASLALTVVDGSDSVPRVAANWTLEPATLRVDQPARLTLSICDDGGLQWQRPPLPTHAGRVLRPLGEDEGEGERDGEACTLHRFHWALLATRSGVATLAVPMIDARRFGQRLRFPAPTLSFDVEALPAWLPSGVPSVAPALVADPLPSRWPLRRPLSWRVEVTGGYSADGIKAVLDLQLRASPALGVYPPLIEALAPDDPNSRLSRYAITLFLEPRASGALTLPALRFPWYDADRGQLASARVPEKTLTVFDPRWQFAMRLAGSILVVLLLGGLIWRIRGMARWRLARWRGLRAIRQACDAQTLARALRQFSLEGQPCAPSLDLWLQRIQRECNACDVIDAVRQLEQLLFGRASHGAQELQRALVRELARARPAGRRWGGAASHDRVTQ